MNKKQDMLVVLEKLKSMDIEERKKYLKQINLTKTQVCDYLINDKVNIPMKSLVLKTLSKMPEEQFLDFISTKIDLLSFDLLSKFVK